MRLFGTGASSCLSVGLIRPPLPTPFAFRLRSTAGRLRTRPCSKWCARVTATLFSCSFGGDALWQGCSDSAVPISLADMDRVRPLFLRRRELYYDRRLDELDRAALVSVAARVAEEFSDTERVLRERVKIAIRSALEREGTTPDPVAVREAERVLRHRGYIWPVVRHSIGYYEPGIPSLMRYVTLNERKNREVRGEAP